MGLMSAVLDHDRVLYFLTLGVLEGHRHRGIASSLVATARQHACETRWAWPQQGRGRCVDAYTHARTHACMYLTASWVGVRAPVAAAGRCRAVFLHVIAYNNAALGLYSRQGFAVVARLPAFYNIATGRQPDPQQQVCLFVCGCGWAAGLGCRALATQQRQPGAPGRCPTRATRPPCRSSPRTRTRSLALCPRPTTPSCVCATWGPLLALAGPAAPGAR
jgi:GNAT superfamily N-acetyltransferase